MLDGCLRSAKRGEEERQECKLFRYYKFLNRSRVFLTLVDFMLVVIYRSVDLVVIFTIVLLVSRIIDNKYCSLLEVEVEVQLGSAKFGLLSFFYIFAQYFI